jgi:hypothetical protein
MFDDLVFRIMCAFDASTAVEAQYPSFALETAVKCPCPEFIEALLVSQSTTELPRKHLSRSTHYNKQHKQQTTHQRL